MNIRRLETPQDYEAFENTMKEIWESGERDIIPSHLLRAINDQGGLILGAFEEEKMVGVLVGFLAYHNGILHHHSHMTGALERHKGIGYQLKQKQREFVLSQGLNLITWTFDPLISSNAYFNFAKLGVISRTYHRNYYGEMRDLLNLGTESDRFLVEWWLKSEDAAKKAQGTFQQPALDEVLSQATVINETEKNDFREITSHNLNLTSRTLLVEIPADINAIKKKNKELARKWRETTREIFENYFAKGYTAHNVISETKEGERRSFYLLRRDTHENPKN